MSARTVTVPIRMTAAERAELDAVAKQSGMGLGTWMRALALGAARTDRPADMVAGVIGAARVARADRRRK